MKIPIGNYCGYWTTIEGEKCGYSTTLGKYWGICGYSAAIEPNFVVNSV